MSMLVSRRPCIVLGLSGQKQAPRFLTLLETALNLVEALPDVCHLVSG